MKIRYFYAKIKQFFYVRKFALIVAGGSGSRMNSPVPKQFHLIKGKPLLMHTFDAFLKSDPDFEFVLVLPGNQITRWKNLCKKYRFPGNHTLAAGGETRFQSVKNGLEKIPEEGIVFIHDGVRPLVSAQTIQNCYKTALGKGNALPVIPPAESVREIFDGENRAVNRERFLLVQTPQTFRVSLIKKAYSRHFSENFTDDASVLENAGEKIHLVPGNRENIKITYLSDLTIAGAFLQK